jgi:hypothetical protein
MYLVNLCCSEAASPWTYLLSAAEVRNVSSKSLLLRSSKPLDIPVLSAAEVRNVSSKSLLLRSSKPWTYLCSVPQR